MNSAERALVTYLTGIKERTLGFMELCTDVPGWSVDIHLDAHYSLFASQCIFDECTDSEATLFLEAFLTGNLSVSWSVFIQLSKLLSKRGKLVSGIIDPLMAKLEWTSYSVRLLFLSYLAVREDGAVQAMKLLDVVPDDGRDGLFLGCHRIQSKELDRKLMKKFLEWEMEAADMSATGQIYALQQFIAKWLGLYPYSDLEGVVRLYFKYCREE